MERREIEYRNKPYSYWLNNDGTIHTEHIVNNDPNDFHFHFQVPRTSKLFMEIMDKIKKVEGR